MSSFAFLMPGPMEILIWLVGLGVLGVISALLIVLVLKKSR